MQRLLSQLHARPELGEVRNDDVYGKALMSLSKLLVSGSDFQLNLTQNRLNRSIVHLHSCLCHSTTVPRGRPDPDSLRPELPT